MKNSISKVIALLIISIVENNEKYKTILSSPEMIKKLCAAAVHITEAAGQGPGHPGPDSAADGNHM